MHSIFKECFLCPPEWLDHFSRSDDDLAQYTGIMFISICYEGLKNTETLHV